jgi:outer membrane protein W
MLRVSLRFALLFVLTTLAAPTLRAQAQEGLTFHAGGVFISSDIAFRGDYDSFVQNDAGMSVAVSYGIWKGLALSLEGLVPFRRQVRGAPIGSSGRTIPIGSFRALPATLTATYRFHSRRRIATPYLGGGLSSTWVWGERVNRDFERTAGSVFPFDEISLEVGHAFGLTAVSGVDWAISPSWGVRSQLSYVRADTPTSLQTNASDDRVNSDDVFSLNSIVFYLGVYFRP